MERIGYYGNRHEQAADVHTLSPSLVYIHLPVIQPCSLVAIIVCVDDGWFIQPYLARLRLIRL